MLATAEVIAVDSSALLAIALKEAERDDFRLTDIRAALP